MIFLAAIEYAILASTFTLGKIAVSFAHPLFLIGIRMMLASPIILIFHIMKNGLKIKIAKKHLKKFLLVGVLHIFIPFVLEFWSLQYVTSSKTAIIFSLTPFIAATLSVFILKVKYNWQQYLALIVGLSGLMPIFLMGGDISFGKEIFYVSLPEFVLLCSVISASYAWFLITDLMKEGYSISLINSFSMMVGGAMSFLLWLILGDNVALTNGTWSDFILWTGLLILVANVISYNFYGWLLKHISITLMSITGFLCPIFASFYGWYFLGEELSFVHALSLVSVIFGLWLFYREEEKSKSWVESQ